MRGVSEITMDRRRYISAGSSRRHLGVLSWVTDSPSLNSVSIGQLYPLEGAATPRKPPACLRASILGSHSRVGKVPVEMAADFMPRSRPALTSHGPPSRWTETEEGCRLQSVAKGQEFVLDLDHYSGVHRLAEALLAA